MTRAVKACRLCGNSELEPVLDLGHQALTGVFPKTRNASITVGPLILMKCMADRGCGLVQLAHSYPAEEMYGLNYGYRSGLNPSMVAHLKSKVDRIKTIGVLKKGDVVLDIGSNDGTTLKQYGINEYLLIGIDPTGRKFAECYSPEIRLIPDFFSSEAFFRESEGRKAKVVTSFAMMYDLEDPIAFAQDVAKVMADDGVWIFEQSYMPSMLEANAYDTVCHEHVEYYGLTQIQWITERAGLRLVDVELNNINGGSFSITAQKTSGSLSVSASVEAVVLAEQRMRLNTLRPFAAFRERVVESKGALLKFLDAARKAGKRISGLGASTKGNVILQYCGIGPSHLACIGEINPDKFGCYTPASNIPIVDEREMIAESPDYVIVFPWHFRKHIDSQPRYAPLRLVYPLPRLSIG